MNKQQKRELVNKRRFHQRVCKLVSKVTLVQLEQATGEANYGTITQKVDNKAVSKFTIKELEHIIARRRDFNSKLVEVVSNEYTERKLLREKTEN